LLSENASHKLHLVLLQLINNVLALIGIIKINALVVAVVIIAGHHQV